MGKEVKTVSIALFFIPDRRFRIVSNGWTSGLHVTGRFAAIQMDGARIVATLGILDEI
jgi:hypothetical protein